jgi:hypothetical protein
MTRGAVVYMGFNFRLGTSRLVKRYMLIHPGQQMSFGLPYIGAACITQTVELVYNICGIGKRSTTLQRKEVTNLG